MGRGLKSNFKKNKRRLTKEKYILELKLRFDTYSQILVESWSFIETIITFQTLKKEGILLRNVLILEKGKKL